MIFFYLYSSLAIKSYWKLTPTFTFDNVLCRYFFCGQLYESSFGAVPQVRRLKKVAQITANSKKDSYWINGVWERVVVIYVYHRIICAGSIDHCVTFFMSRSIFIAVVVVTYTPFYLWYLGMTLLYLINVVCEIESN